MKHSALRARKVENVIKKLESCGWNRQAFLDETGMPRSELSQHVKMAKELGIKLPTLKDFRPSTERKPRSTGTTFPSPYVEKQREPVSACNVDIELVQEAASRYGRQIDVMIARKNWNGAHAIIERAKACDQGGKRDEPILEVYLSSIIGAKESNALEKIGLTKVGDLARFRSGNLLKMTNFGTKSLDAVWWAVLKLAVKRDIDREEAVAQLNHRNEE